MKTNHRGIATLTILIIVLGLAVLGGGAYVAFHPSFAQKAEAPTTMEDDGVQTEPGDHMEVDHDANEGIQTNVSTKTSISWKLESAGESGYVSERTKVTAVVNGKSYDMGIFNGSCNEIGASGGMGGGLLAGELAALQCFYAGSGDEVGVFAHEDGGFDIMVGELGEPNPADDIEGWFRGNFKVKFSI